MTLDGIRFLTSMDIIALHEHAMSMSDQAPAVLVREDMLHSAVAQARQLAWYENAPIAAVAVHLCTRIALAHPWIDGNKRTAAYSGLQFAALNGARDPRPDGMLAFADLLLRHIEAPHDQRVNVLREFVGLVETWFDQAH